MAKKKKKDVIETIPKQVAIEEVATEGQEENVRLQNGSDAKTEQPINKGNYILVGSSSKF